MNMDPDHGKILEFSLSNMKTLSAARMGIAIFPIS